MRKKRKLSAREQRKKDLKKTRRKNILRRTVLILICAAALGMIGYCFVSALNSGVFNVKTIEVEGTEIIPAQTIISESGIKEGDNIFLVNANEASGNISENLMTRKLIVRKVMPDKIVISVQEKPVLFAVSDNGQICYFGDDLELITRSEYLTKSDVPLISGLNSYQISGIGDKITAEPAYKFDNIVNMLKTFESNGLLNRISEISLQQDNTYRIITKDNTVITVKDTDNFGNYFGYIKTVIENGESNLDINLNAGNNPIQKPRS
ncbi:MAG: cell division protein FtsQ/DivIB [Eubacteriaceae bacterium]